MTARARVRASSGVTPSSSATFSMNSFGHPHGDGLQLDRLLQRRWELREQVVGLLRRRAIDEQLDDGLDGRSVQRAPSG
jgi:hypothetical protein